MGQKPTKALSSPYRYSRPLPLELNCEIFECLKLPIQRKFICGLGRGIYGMSRQKVLIKKKKRDILAELHRRLNPPKCLNTSYLNSILRRGINKHGGSHLRGILAGYGCGLESVGSANIFSSGAIPNGVWSGWSSFPPNYGVNQTKRQTPKKTRRLEMQASKRKSIQVTIFSALCERESINMVNNLGKIIKDLINGFPHVKVAEEMGRRELCQHKAKSPEQQKKRLLDIRSTMAILREAIGFVQMGIENETHQLATIAEKMPTQPKDNELMPQTLDRFKRFAWLSHCFGNRTVFVSLQTLLEVLGQLERIQTEGYLQSAGLGGIVSHFGPSV